MIMQAKALASQIQKLSNSPNSQETFAWCVTRASVKSASKEAAQSNSETLKHSLKHSKLEQEHLHDIMCDSRVVRA